MFPSAATCRHLWNLVSVSIIKKSNYACLSCFSVVCIPWTAQPISSIFRQATELVGSTIINLIYRGTMVFKNQNVRTLRISTSFPLLNLKI